MEILPKEQNYFQVGSRLQKHLECNCFVPIVWHNLRSIFKSVFTPWFILQRKRLIGEALYALIM